MTRSPGRTVRTSDPTASTTPAPSAPTMWGKWYSCGSPRTTNKSRWLSAAARTATRTWPGSGFGSSGTSLRWSPPVALIPQARMSRPPSGTHDSCSIGAHDVGEVVLVWQPPHYEQVEVVERRGAHRDADVAGVRVRELGDVAELELVEAAGGADHPGAHGETALRHERGRHHLLGAAGRDCDGRAGARADRLDVHAEHVLLYRHHQAKQVTHSRDGEIGDHQIRARERRDLPRRHIGLHHLGGGAPSLFLLHQIGERAVAQEVRCALLGLRAPGERMLIGAVLGQGE